MGEVLRHAGQWAPAAADPSPYADQRGAVRHTLLIRAAKLIAPGGEYLCVIRDASETGASVRLFHPLPEEGNMLLELQNGDRHEVEIVWSNEDKAGLRFCGPVDVSRIIESPSRFSKRPVRLNVTCPARILASGTEYRVEVQDISQQGAKVGCDYRFPIDQRVILKADDIPNIHAKIRWRREDSCGLIFENTFQFGELARIVAVLQAKKSDR